MSRPDPAGVRPESGREQIAIMQEAVVPERRFDPLSLRWVLIAPERARRPGAEDAEPDEDRDRDPAPCDFCSGREDSTPAETFRLPYPGPWRVRVFPNRYPATRFHEVVVHAPDHDALLEDLAPDHVGEVVSAWRARLRESESVCGLVLLNRGRDAGASRVHDHSQLVGFDVVPPILERETQAMSGTTCPACELARSEELQVSVHDAVSVVVHPAPQLAHELLLIPPHETRFESTGDETARAFASAMRDGLLRLRKIGIRAFNVVLHTAPRASGSFHWHAHIYPRTSTLAGMEIGAGIPVIAADPAQTAERLRST